VGEYPCCCSESAKPSINGPLGPARKRRIVFGAEKYSSIMMVSFGDLPEMA
jgi:hypothetical protein